MGIHFDTITEARRHLTRMGWSNWLQGGDDFWLSRNGDCRAWIETFPGSKVVCVHARRN